MGKKLDKLAARIQALEEAIATLVTGKKPKKSARKKSVKAKSKKVAAKKPAAKPAAPKKAKRRARKAKRVTPPLPLAATL
jgi:cell division protein FtsB